MRTKFFWNPAPDSIRITLQHVMRNSAGRVLNNI